MTESPPSPFLTTPLRQVRHVGSCGAGATAQATGAEGGCLRRSAWFPHVGGSKRSACLLMLPRVVRRCRQMVEKQGWTYVSKPNQLIRDAHPSVGGWVADVHSHRHPAVRP
jgi:hypothetical protein